MTHFNKIIETWLDNDAVCKTCKSLILSGADSARSRGALLDVSADELRDVCTNTSDGKRALAEFVAAERESVEPPDNPDLLPLSRSELSFVRVRSLGVDEDLVAWGPWGVVFTLARRVWPDGVFAEVVAVLREMNVFGRGKRRLVMQSLKKLSTLIKKFNYGISPNWRFYMYLELWGGHMSAVQDEEEMVSDVMKWVTGEKEWSIAGSEDLFYAQFGDACKRLLARGKPDQSRWLSVRDWLRDRTNWAKSSTATFSNTQHVQLSKIDGVAKSKWTVAFNAGIDRLMQLFTEMGWVSKAFIKMEETKARLVIGGAIEAFLKQGWIGSMIESALRNGEGYTWSTLFMSAEQMVEFQTTTTEMYGLAGLSDSEIRILWPRSKEIVSMPLDQDRFDWNVTQRMLREMVLAVKHTLKTWGAGPTAMSVCDMILRDVTSDRVEIILPNKSRVKVTKGLLSGWRWTALWGSLTTAALLSVADGIVRAYVGRTDALMLMGQGDDAMTKFKSYAGAVLYWRVLTMMGMSVNPNKFFINCTDDAMPLDEYLRLNYEGSSVVGYVNRALATVARRKPWLSAPDDDELTINSDLDMWVRLVARGCPLQNVTSICWNDIAIGNKISVQNAIDWAHTPACYGGGGLTPWSTRWLSATVLPVEKRTIRGSALASEMREMWGEGPDWDKVATSYLNFKDAKRPMVVLKEQESATWLRVELGVELALSPSYIPPAVGRDEALRYYLENTSPEEWTHGLGKFMSPKSVDDAITIFRRVSINVFRAWLTGSLPFSLPRDWELAPLVLGVTAKKIQRQVWAGLVLTRNNVGMDSVQRAALWSERRILAEARRLKVRISG